MNVSYIDFYDLGIFLWIEWYISKELVQFIIVKGKVCAITTVCLQNFIDFFHPRFISMRSMKKPSLFVLFVDQSISVFDRSSLS